MTIPLNLPTSEELVVEAAELRSILSKIAKRSAGGRAVSGRYNKHDMARLRFIRSIALPGIRFGQLVPDDDMRMLRLGPMNVLQGVDLASMDEWAQRHGRDPRSKKKDGWLDETEQATLFRWLSSNEKHLVLSVEPPAPRTVRTCQTGRGAQAGEPFCAGSKAANGLKMEVRGKGELDLRWRWLAFGACLLPVRGGKANIS